MANGNDGRREEGGLFARIARLFGGGKSATPSPVENKPPTPASSAPEPPPASSAEPEPPPAPPEPEPEPPAPTRPAPPPETKVRTRLEFALARPGTAVGHNLTGIPDTTGPLGHLIATPMTVWLIEEESDGLEDELTRMASNLKALRKWAPRRMTVKGVMIVKSKPDADPWFDRGGERIEAHDTESFVRALQRDSRQSGGEDTSGVTDKIWNLAAKQAR